MIDPMHTGRVRIQDIIASGFLDELLEVSVYNFLFKNDIVIVLSQHTLIE